MNRRPQILLVAAGLLLVGCIPSVNPWYALDDVQFDPVLLGAWSDGDEIWTFERGANQAGYQLTISESGKRSTFTATLFALRGNRFLDIIPDAFEIGEDEVDLIEAALFPGHLALHVAEIEPALSMAFADPDWLEDLLDENPRALSHRIEGDDILLTGSTRELRRFLLRHFDGGEMFEAGSYGELVKRP